MSELSIIGLIFLVGTGISWHYERRAIPQKTIVQFMFWPGIFWGIGLITLDLGQEFIGKIILGLALLFALIAWILKKVDHI